MNLSINKMYSEVNRLVEKLKDDKLTVISDFLGDRIENADSYVMMFGETSSGKSTIVNGLMQENNLFVSASPSTGSITEIEFKDKIDVNKMYAINRDATIEEIDNKMFNNLIKNPDNNLQRLKLVTKTPRYKLNNMRLFDTPGYGSIVDEHDEILKEFIPNADVIVYTINHKIGIQENDYTFLRYIKQVVRENIEIVIVINRCPKNIDYKNKRVIEIKKYLESMINYTPEIFLVENEVLENEDEYPLPECKEIWSYIESIINSDKRKKELEESFKEYIIELLYECEDVIQKRYEEIKMSIESKKIVKENLNILIEKINNIVPNMINPAFDNLINSMDKTINNAESNVKNNIGKYIDDTKQSKKDETIAYINSHLLPYRIEQEMNNVIRYVEITMDDLNEKIDDYLNEEIITFNNEIEICFNNIYDVSKKTIFKEGSKKIVNGGLITYFSKFGGAGKAGAGVANAASHTLKVVGKKFGKTFSRATHNGLKQMLKKIGLTSVKGIGIAVTIIVEVLFEIVDYATWKNKLTNKSTKAIDKWKEETLVGIKEDLENLRNENINTIKEIAEIQMDRYNYEEEIPNEKDTNELIDLLDIIKKDLGVN